MLYEDKTKNIKEALSLPHPNFPKLFEGFENVGYSAKEIARKASLRSKVNSSNSERMSMKFLPLNNLVRIIGGEPGHQHPYGMIGIIIGSQILEDGVIVYNVEADNYDYWYFEEELEIIRVGAIIK